jgi:hypothetical protein
MLAGEDKTDDLVTWRFSMKRSRNSPVQHMEPIPALLFRRDAKNEGNHSVKRPCFTVMAASISGRGRGRWSNWNWSTEFGHVGSPLRQRWAAKNIEQSMSMILKSASALVQMAGRFQKSGRRSQNYKLGGR